MCAVTKIAGAELRLCNIGA